MGMGRGEGEEEGEALAAGEFMVRGSFRCGAVVLSGAALCQGRGTVTRRGSAAMGVPGFERSRELGEAGNLGKPGTWGATSRRPPQILTAPQMTVRAAQPAGSPGHWRG